MSLSISSFLSDYFIFKPALQYDYNSFRLAYHPGLLAKEMCLGSNGAKKDA
jgi:hypothetical protein